MAAAFSIVRLLTLNTVGITSLNGFSVLYFNRPQSVDDTLQADSYSYRHVLQMILTESSVLANAGVARFHERQTATQDFSWIAAKSVQNSAVAPNR